MSKQMITDYSHDNAMKATRADVDQDEVLRSCQEGLKRIVKENSIFEIRNIAEQLLDRIEPKKVDPPKEVYDMDKVAEELAKRLERESE